MLTEKQRETRRQGLGSSDAAPALGMSRFRSRYELWLEKAGIVAPAELDFWAIHRGNALEGALLDWYARAFSVEVEQSPATVRHPKHSFLLAHLDGLARSGSDAWIVEAKTAFGGSRRWGDPGTADVDPEYLWQGVHQMAAADLDRVDFVVDFGWAAPAVFRLRRDMALEAEVVELELEFWDLVERREPPEVDHSEGCRRHLETMVSSSPIERRAATPEEQELASWLSDLLAAHKEAGQEIDRLKNRLRRSMGSCQRIDGPDFHITWNIDKNGVRSFRPTFYED